jgi:DNA-binding cell septation regulator SpoVG
MNIKLKRLTQDKKKKKLCYCDVIYDNKLIIKGVRVELKKNDFYYIKFPGILNKNNDTTFTILTFVTKNDYHEMMDAIRGEIKNFLGNFKNKETSCSST